MNKTPFKAKLIVEEAAKNIPSNDINELHAATYVLMKKYRNEYYITKVKNFLSRKSLRSISRKDKDLLIEELLKPIIVKNKNKKDTYSNFMEEASRRISQVFQVLSGNIAELCVEQKLIEVGLERNVHFLRRKDRADFTFYHPNIQRKSNIHRVEVKNVALRERGVRGLAFDGDSLFGFFNDAAEFTSNTAEIINKHCKKNNGFCYIPPKIIFELGKKIKGKRFKPNLVFSQDMVRFVKTGTI